MQPDYIDNYFPGNTNIVIQQKYANVLFKISHLFIISSAVAFYRQHYDFCCINGIWYVTSTIYWYKPRYDYKRIIDIVAVNSGIAYHVYRGWNSSNANILIWFLVIIVLCYYYSNIYHIKNELWMSTYLHCGVHTIGFITNIVFYFGCIDNCK